jgi:hypothetical protein
MGLEKEMGCKLFEFKKRKLRYIQYTCSYRCGLLRDLCERNKKQNCDRYDVTYGRVMMGFREGRKLRLEDVIRVVMESKFE